MGDQDARSGSNVGVVIVVALLVLAVPCCGGLAVLGLGLFGVRSVARPAPVIAPPIQVQPAPAPTINEEAPPAVAAPELAPPINDAQPTPPSP